MEQTPYLPVCIMVISRLQSASDVQWGEAGRPHPKKVWVEGAMLASQHGTAWKSKHGTVEVGAGQSLPELSFICLHGPCSVYCGAHLANCCCCWEENIYFPSPSALPPASLQPLHSCPASCVASWPTSGWSRATHLDSTNLFSCDFFFCCCSFFLWFKELNQLPGRSKQGENGEEEGGKETGVPSPSATPNCNSNQSVSVYHLLSWFT